MGVIFYVIMVRYTENEEVRIVGGKYKQFKTAIFKKYTGRLSCVVEQKDVASPCLWTLRLTSIKKINEKSTKILVDKKSYESLLEDLNVMKKLLNQIDVKLQNLKLDNDN